jgi:4-aminobutyrate aminotransferase/(S)-3-amino-2-methylpropionate transaminase
VVAFEGGYHGLAHGALSICGFGEGFRAPFAGQLNQHVCFAPFPDGSREGGSGGSGSAEAALEAVRECGRRSSGPGIGAVVVEPILGRGGVVVPPDGFLAGLRGICREWGALLVVDEIFTGLGRCGEMWRSAVEGAEPDVICAGKALGGGLPVSACIGRGEVMAAWGEPGAEALYTGTFFGNPLGCAASLATLDVVQEEGLLRASRLKGERLLRDLREMAERCDAVTGVRGAGLMVGVELGERSAALRVGRKLLERGFIVVPAGADARVVSVTPPLNIDDGLLQLFVEALEGCLAEGA